MALIGYAVWSSTQRAALAGQAHWQDFPNQGQEHIEVGVSHPAYNSDPPTSGPHYKQPAKAGFYDEAVEDEYLVHSMEHGYVIIWYNCEKLSDADCAGLKAQIRQVMQDEGTAKLIAAPRTGMASLIALTAWTRLDRLDLFDDKRIKAFVEAFRGQGPEPNAP